MSELLKIVAHPELGTVVTPTKNPEFGAIRVDSEGINPETGFYSNNSALIRGPIEALKKMAENRGWKDGTTMKGGIKTSESFTPFWKEQKPKTKGKGGENVLKDGKPVYRTTTPQIGDYDHSYVQDFDKATVEAPTVKSEEGQVNPALDKM